MIIVDAHAPPRLLFHTPYCLVFTNRKGHLKTRNNLLVYFAKEDLLSGFMKTTYLSRK